MEEMACRLLCWKPPGSSRLKTVGIQDMPQLCIPCMVTHERKEMIMTGFGIDLRFKCFRRLDQHGIATGILIHGLARLSDVRAVVVD